MVEQRLWAIVGVPNTGIIAVECCPSLEIPLYDKPLKRPGIHNKVLDIRLLILPQLGRSMLAEGIDETVGGEHRESFRVRLAMIPRFAVSQVSQVSLSPVYSHTVERLRRDERDGWDST